MICTQNLLNENAPQSQFELNSKTSTQTQNERLRE